jgi:hypothetical protein
MKFGRVLYDGRMFALHAAVTKRRKRWHWFAKELLLEVVIPPRPGNYSGAITGTDLFFISLDQEIDCRGINITFLEQNGLKGTDTQFRLRQVGMIVIVQHGTTLSDPDYLGKMPIRVPLPKIRLRARFKSKVTVAISLTRYLT